MTDRRTHIVLVPGFGGFDALGQLEYYAGTTKLFETWRNADPADDERSRAVLHYFSNLPTAAVETRAERLRRFLAKRLIRNEIQASDAIVLVGHSTGGLDIRRLLSTLIATRDEEMPLDGAEDWAVGGRLLSMIERVVFLSVPHQGTNLADWARLHRGPSKIALRSLRTGHGIVHKIPYGFPLSLLDRSADSRLPDIALAALDSIFEASTHGATSGIRAADAREAMVGVSLWLRHIGHDFLALDDLASAGEGNELARAGKEALEAEAEAIRSAGIATRSYATRGVDPNGEPTSSELRSSLDLLRFAVRNALRDHALYRCLHYLCSAGPFEPRFGAAVATSFESGEAIELSVGDNDGIVNTASMLWPDGRDTLVIESDHGDAIGHFARVESADPEDGRGLVAYDLLRSPSSFDAAKFEALWSDVFTFAVGSAPEARRAPRSPVANRGRQRYDA